MSFTVLGIILIHYDNTELKVMDAIEEHGNISTMSTHGPKKKDN